MLYDFQVKNECDTALEPMNGGTDTFVRLNSYPVESPPDLRAYRSAACKFAECKPNQIGLQFETIGIVARPDLQTELGSHDIGSHTCKPRLTGRINMMICQPKKRSRKHARVNVCFQNCTIQPSSHVQLEPSGSRRTSRWLRRRTAFWQTATPQRRCI